MFKKYDFLRMKLEIIRKNPASPDTPVSKLTAWSITILVFLMKNKNLWRKEKRKKMKFETNCFKLPSVPRRHVTD